MINRTFLALPVDGNLEQNVTVSGDVAANSTDISLASGVGVIDRRSIGRDAGAGAAALLADLHTLDSLASILSNDGGDIEAGPAAIAGAAEVELTPGRGVAATRVKGHATAGSGSETAVGVVVEGDVLGLTGVEGKREGGVAEPAVHLAVGAVLVEEDQVPGLAVLAGDLGDVLVVRGIIGGDLDDVATVGVADVALVGDSGAGVGGFSTEAATGRGRGGRGRRGRGGSRGGGGGLTSLVALRAGKGSGAKGCQQQKRLGELHFLKECEVASSDDDIGLEMEYVTLGNRRE